MFGFLKKLTTKKSLPKNDGNREGGSIGFKPSGVLDVALMLHQIQRNPESLSRFLQTLGSEFVFILAPADMELDGAATTEGSDGGIFLAIFSSTEKAATAAASTGSQDQPLAVSPLQIVLRLSADTGIVLNPTLPPSEWTFTPPQVAGLRELYTESFQFPVGGLFVLRRKRSYVVAKILVTDDHGIHLRVYSNQWGAPPTAVDSTQLNLAGADESAGLALGYGHLPMTRRAFLEQGPVYVSTVPVVEEELDGYAVWKESNGGYFGS